MSTFVFEVESDFEWTEEKVVTIINAIEAEGPTVVDEYPVSDDDVLKAGVLKTHGFVLDEEGKKTPF